MHIPATPAQARTILGAMRAVAEAGSAFTDADRTSIVAAARYIFKLTLPPDLAGLTPPTLDELKALAANPDLATEAVRFATVMAFVDGTLDNAKLAAVLALAATLGVEADFVHDIAELAQGHLHEATAHMIRANLESITGKTWSDKPWTTDDDAMAFFLPYKGANADPALAARFRALAQLPEGTFGHAFAVFYLSQKYAFPGEEAALNIKFAAPHDSAHLLAGYDTTPRGELLVSTFTAAMHRKEAMSGHVLPVLFSWHLGIALNEVAGAAKGALDPQEFWHAMARRKTRVNALKARGERMKVDLFGPEWDFWAAACEPIETVRARIGLTP